MKIGAHLPQLGRGATRDALVEFCARAERLGVHSGWVSDHIAWPARIASRYPYSDDGSFGPPNDMEWLEPNATLLFAAALTEHMRLGQSVMIMGYRPPVQTAKIIATLDRLSNGRAILGAGIGWMREEFDVLGMPFDHRGARADEQLEIFSKLFNEREPSHEGRFYRFPPICFEPKPVQAHVPVWIGGSSEAAFARVARVGDCFHAAFQPLDVVSASWQRVRRLVEAHGRDPDRVELAVRLYLDPGATMDPRVSVQGGAQEMADTVEAWQAIGVDHLLVDVTAPGGPAGRLDALSAFMTDVIGTGA